MKKVMIVLEILILLGLSGCGKSGKKSIIGKWKEVSGTQIIEFFKDGTVIVKDKGDPTLTGDYRFIDDNRIRMDLKGLGELFGPIIAEISFSRDEITLTAPDGEIEKYRKLKKIRRSSIVGKYIMEVLKEGKFKKEPEGMFFFKKDGTVAIRRPDSDKWKVEGTWRIENGAVIMSGKQNESQGRMGMGRMEIEGNTIIIKAPNGKVIARLIKQN